MLLDAHAHYYIQDGFDIETFPTDMITIMTGMNHESNQVCLKLSKQDETNRIKATVGFHPCNITTEQQFTEAMEELANIQEYNPNSFVAIAEIGLDYFHNKDPIVKEFQKKAFEAYCLLAQELQKPIVLHTRNAVQDILDILERLIETKKFKQTIVMHCFEASVKNIERAKQMGCYFTIPAAVGRNELFQRLVKTVPMNRMLTETDAPFQGPEKGVPAKPHDVKVALEYISKVQGMDVLEVEHLIFNNYLQVFS
jgi:TatD DNase family protein